MYLLYAHGGSGNHGCEAIVRATAAMLTERPRLFSLRPEEDELYGLTGIADVSRAGKPVRYGSAEHIWLKANSYLRDTTASRARYTDGGVLRTVKSGDVCVSVGGDNYCYGAEAQKAYAYINSSLRAAGAKTVLWGCSVEPDDLRSPELARELADYSLITARETLTYNAMRDAGLENVRLYPDPAFTLEPLETPLPEGFVPGKTVGINISPLAIGCETERGAAEANVAALIEYILENTGYGVALIPHVVWNGNDDRVPLTALQARFAASGRVLTVPDADCRKLKYVISKCAAFVGARTHATIAAYSTGVPTLVLGYSVKARGIARDLFGTDEGYVLPVQTLRGEGELKAAFSNLLDRSASVSRCLGEQMPAYIARARSAAAELGKL